MIRIVIADDHPVVRRGIRGLLETEADMVVVAEAINGEEAITAVSHHTPDILLIDLVMPVLDGISAIHKIRSSQPDVRILVLTSFATDDQVFPAIKAGALGYLIKDTAPDDLLQAIRQVHQGEPTLHPKIAKKLLSEIAQPAAQPPSPDPLTGREIDVLKLIARGLDNQQIAAELTISIATVYTHVSNILAKLHLASRTQAALYALREGYASLYEPK